MHMNKSPNLSFDRSSERLSESLCWSDRRTSPASGTVCSSRTFRNEWVKKKRDWGKTERCVIPADILLLPGEPIWDQLNRIHNPGRSTLNLILVLKVFQAFEIKIHPTEKKNNSIFFSISQRIAFKSTLMKGKSAPHH